MADKYDISLPPGVEWGYQDTNDYLEINMAYDGVSPMKTEKEFYGDEILQDDMVYITNFAFEYSTSELQLVGTMKHESDHAWGERSFEVLGNPYGLPEDLDDLKIVLEANAYTAQRNWLEEHGETLDSFDSGEMDKYVKKSNTLFPNRYTFPMNWYVLE